MSGSRSRTKGARYERDLANRWKASGLYPDARRGIGQARSSGEVADVEGTPWWVEAKCQARPNVFAAMEQAEAATDGRPPIVVATRREAGKPSRASTVVVMRMETFEMLAERAELVGRIES